MVRYINADDEITKQPRDYVNTYRTVLNDMKQIGAVYDHIQGVQAVMFCITTPAQDYRFIEEFGKNIEESKRKKKWIIT